MENIHQELPYVLETILGHENFTSLPVPKDKQSKSKLLQFVKQVPIELVLRVMKRYQTDFETFDYQVIKSEQDISNAFE